MRLGSDGRAPDKRCTRVMNTNHLTCLGIEGIDVKVIENIYAGFLASTTNYNTRVHVSLCKAFVNTIASGIPGFRQWMKNALVESQFNSNLKTCL